LPWYQGEKDQRQFYPHESKNRFPMVKENSKEGSTKNIAANEPII